MLAIAASYDWNVIQLDVQTAFLQSERKEDIYVKQAVGFENLDLNGQSYAVSYTHLTLPTILRV